MNNEARATLFDKIGKPINGDTELVKGLPKDFVFNVEKVPLLYTGTTGEIKRLDGKSTVINMETGRAYGPVSDKYCPIPNLEALGSVAYIKDFTLCKFGETKGGTQWLIGKLPEKKILGDEFTPYIVFRNSFNGSAPVQMAMAPLRIVCKNQISLAMRSSNYSYSLKHTKNAGEQIDEAQKIFLKANDFMTDLERMAEGYSKVKLSDVDISRIITDLIPLTENMSDLQRDRAEARRVAFIDAINAQDLANHKGSAWGLINAYSDLITHYQPVRTTETAQENSFLTVTFDPRWMTALVKAVGKVAA